MDRRGDQQVELARVLGIQAQAYGRNFVRRRWHLDELLGIADHYQVPVDYLVRGQAARR